jgi:hypothetical protein
MSKSYICQTCGVEHDSIPKALACFEAHEAEAGATVEVVDEGQPYPPKAPEVPEPLAAELLGRAAAHMHARSATYDAPGGERSMGKAVAAFNAITGHSLTESEGWLLLQVLKDVRLFTRSEYHADSAEDCIAYAALKAEAKGKGR